MVRKRKDGSSIIESSAALQLQAEETKGKASDPWMAIENGHVRTAREVFYKATSPQNPIRHFGKKKRQRISDGSKALRVEMHGQIAESRRDRGQNCVVYSPVKEPVVKRSKTRHGSVAGEDGSFNVFANVIKDKETQLSDKKEGVKRLSKHQVKEINENDTIDEMESDGGHVSELDEEYDDVADEQDIDDDDVSDVASCDNGTSDGNVRNGRVVVTEKRLSKDVVWTTKPPYGEEEDDDDDETFNSEDVADEISSGDTSEEELSGVESLEIKREAVVLKCSDVDANALLPNFDMFPFTEEDSGVSATRAFAWMIAPCDVQTFFKDFFESNAVVAKRGLPDYYSNLFSTARLVELLEKNHLEYDTNINIAEYKNGVRTTVNGTGRVYPHHLTQHLCLGRSVQLVNPQTFDDRVWYLCEVLQEMFGCFVGANTYLTPRGSAGFAPHWDEIDAFLLQLEGKKYWKVYAPDSIDNTLPRESSGNFTDADMKDRVPVFDGWIEAGDLLYIPRGFIHQARTGEDMHSLHITISSGRLWSFADLFEKLLPEALSSLAKSRWKMRKSLPVGMLDMGGVADIDYRLQERFEKEWGGSVDRNMVALRNSLSNICDGGIDLMAKQFMRTALPPMLTPEEKQYSVVGRQANILSEEEIEFRPSTKVKLIRRHGQRLFFESEESCYIAHRMANSRLYEGFPEQTFELPLEFVSGFNALCDNYPEWLSLSDMPDDMNGAEVQAMCHLLYYHGLLMVKQLPDRVKRKVKKMKR